MVRLKKYFKLWELYQEMTVRIDKTRHIYIIGSRGIPVGYSGYETFVLKLTEYSKEFPEIKYHIACRDYGDEGDYNNASRFYIKTWNIGNAKAIPYDVFAFVHAIKDIKKNDYKDAWIYILACRIGPFMSHLVSRAHQHGVMVAVNPDGHEWMRGKWNKYIKRYWKYSEKLMTKYADLMVCDSTEMETYIKEEYKQYRPNTTYLSYGADENIEFCTDEQIDAWYKKYDLKEKQYYLIVGRFIPENNYELMIREFMKTDSKKALVLITDIKESYFLDRLRQNTGFEEDDRIKFVGTVFDKPLINRIRKQAFIYFHGHEVGGTNPSLLEAMACQCVICAVDVGFSREVLGNNGIFFKKDDGDLSGIITELENNEGNFLVERGLANLNRVREKYNWMTIAETYRQLWITWDK